MAAMLFVKGGATYIRAATNVQKSDDSGRAIGTTLARDPLESINAGKAFLGEVPVLGMPCVGRYERSRMHQVQRLAPLS